MEYITLRSYQLEDAIQPVIRRFASGHKQAALCFPTGSGKSFIATYIAKELTKGEWTKEGLATFGMVWLASPLSSVVANLVKGKQKFMRIPGTPFDPEVCPKTNGWGTQKGTIKAKDYRPKDRHGFPHGKLHASTNAYLFTWFQAVRKFPDLTGCLLILDEGHHTASVWDSKDGNTTCQIRDAWLAAGGSVLYLTATPFRSDGAPIYDVDEVAPFYRSMAKHAEEGYAPKDWKLSTDVMKGCRNKGTADDLRIGAEHLARYWDKHDRPKAIIKVQHSGLVEGDDSISEAWAVALCQAFLKYLKPDRIFNAVGTKRAASVARRMKKENAADTYEDSTCDVIIACKRFDEAADWAFCAAVYPIGPPMRSVAGLIQLQGRAMRLKKWDPEIGGIKGYPQEYEDKAVMVAFLYDLVERDSENAKEQQRRVLLMTAMQEQQDYGQNAQNFRHELRSSLGKGSVRESLEQIFEKVSVVGMPADLLVELATIPVLHKLTTNKEATLKDVYRALKGLNNSHRINLLEKICGQAAQANPDQAARIKEYVQRAKQGILHIATAHSDTEESNCSGLLEDFLAGLLEELVEQHGHKIIWSQDTLFNSEARMSPQDAKAYAASLSQEELLNLLTATDDEACLFMQESLSASKHAFPHEKYTFKAYGKAVAYANLDAHIRKRGVKFSLGVDTLSRLSSLVCTPQSFTRVEILTAIRKAKASNEYLIPQTHRIPMNREGAQVVSDAKYDASKAFGKPANWGVLALALDRGWWGLPSGLSLDNVATPPWGTGWVLQGPPSKETVLKAAQQHFTGRRPTAEETFQDASQWFPQYGDGMVIWKDVLPIIGW